MAAVITEEEHQRRHWRLVWLSSIQAFADSETQRTRWLDVSERNPAFSFVECMCSYFDDTNLSEENAYPKRVAAGDVSLDEAAAVAEFHALAEVYESPGADDYDHQRILQDAKWQVVVDAARTAQTRLLPLLQDDTERLALTQPLLWEERDGAFYADLIGSRIMRAGKWLAEQNANSLRRLINSLRRKLFGAPNA